MKIKKLTPQDRSRWDLFVEKHPQSKIYHKYAWKEIIEKSFSKQALYYLAEQNGQVKGILPLIKFHTPLTGKALISIPYVNYGGILSDCSETQKQLLEKAETVRRENGSASVEFRTMQENNYDLPVKTNKVTFFLDLPDNEEVLMKQFKAKLRSQIRRPSKEGMVVKSGGQELLKDFYAVFCRNMRDLGTPVYGITFFKNICFFLPENHKIVVVYTKEGKAVAAAFLFFFKDTVEIPWASALRAYNRFSPNMLLYWKVLSEAIKEGKKKFDFGRGTKNGGTYRFKKQWGGRETQLYWHYLLPQDAPLPEVSKENPKYALAISMWKKMPLILSNLLGPHIVKHLP